MRFVTGLVSPTTILVCTAVAGSNGLAPCNGNVPTGTNAGATGAHVIQGTGATSNHMAKGVFTLT